MPELISLAPASPWVELRVTQADWKAADPAVLGTLLSHMHLIRAFEETVVGLALDGLVHGPAHSSIGQEGGAAGALALLTSADQVNGSHRGHHHFLSKALAHLMPAGVDPRAELPPAVRALLQRTLAEILGLSQGFCHGRGGSMHLRWDEAGVTGTNAIVGGGVPLAAGSAWAHRHAGTDAVAVTFFGDGAVNIGSVLETMNLAAAWKLPLCFFIENNRYAVSTHVEEATAEPRLSARGAAFNIPSWKVDGMDAYAVHLAMQQALAHMRAGRGPTVIEADVYRFLHQNGGFPGSAFGYRSKEEEAAWRKRDPLDQLAARMQKLRLIEAAEVDALRARMQAAMQDAVEALTEPDPAGKAGKKRIRPELWPDPGFRDVGLRGDLRELQGARCEEESTFRGELRERKFIDVVAETMDRRMAADARIVVLGEDVHRLKGGTNGATRGLKDKYPSRVLGTPISENAFAGLGGGMAMDGRFRPVVEFMYPDFLWVAADQVFNQIGKARHMFGGDIDVPLVLRSKVAMGTGYGSQHSMDPAGIFVTSPGWRIVAPSTPFDYVGLMNAALQLEDPVLVIEHVDLYAASGPAPVDDFDYQTAFGKAAVRRAGAEVTVLTYLSMVWHALEAVERTGVDAEVVDLRWLDRASLDWETIGASIRKTNNVLIVEQGAQGTSYGGWLADEIQRRFFDWLDQPVQRVTGGEASPSISKVLERAACARTEEVVEGLERVMRGQGAPVRGQG
ncbi:Branched-chain alpha-keto acid dehydrogenase, E1 component, alpha subunit / Branched-chain alpha-keto acid dehydrogenase, E1 component, beta subunit [Castellaniella defragrans 65Phen]|jgi:2-oxoisovalerate dehydrogenase E1 component|uniref:Branched-chain alpha-keto acid dehydrogenase, E1 component, alpha subunit / Branched-chain alpha-keto acid dehydrogenase, E1 component, beta subunit n=2 Tax=Castellaniella defragrans TaxID=75697 RepID=W8X3J6_CASD6|nr:alpha-ketoacid dehydrogenase subunit alpha/beta [Castellaniella defragrans]KAB0603690.1 MFS transporter [Castellaniella defragrans]MBB6082916.1 2-oxoisovalerate dehydrogenase E1 component [Castellaniella defragrans]CDM23816.1 Branched-chain alpha-keto acid dehydrogenase, E1 component, alpha subunit / Branched-chain alpha-keto acid dehydrogenase, E1 component, beta subunit [Castellaniella defragrans 65Phen]